MTIKMLFDDGEKQGYLGTEYRSDFAQELFPDSGDFFDRYNQSFLSECIRMHRNEGGANSVAALIVRINDFVPEMMVVSHERWAYHDAKLLHQARESIIPKLKQLPEDKRVF